MTVPNDICMKMDTAMTLIRTADAVAEKDRPGVYRAAKSILDDIGKDLDMMITVSDVMTEEEDE